MLLARVAKCETDVQKIRFIKPETGSIFVRLFLGRVDVRVPHQNAKEVLRDEYDKFRDRTNFV